jgi:hypothetical protein
VFLTSTLLLELNCMAMAGIWPSFSRWEQATLSLLRYFIRNIISNFLFFFLSCPPDDDLFLVATLLCRSCICCSMLTFAGCQFELTSSIWHSLPSRASASSRNSPLQTPH